jgi:predicted small secreted protein
VGEHRTGVAVDLEEGLMRRNALLVALSAVSALVLGACYGSTEPATGVGEDTAVLHGQGTADKGAATSYFEYWATGDPAPDYPKPKTPTRSWPARASGPISERVSDLLVASQYTYRLCGQDQSTPTVCAQTRTFTTATPPGDYVKGSLSFAGAQIPPNPIPPFVLRFNARSGATGQDPKGTVTEVKKDGSRSVRKVTCLRASGGQAKVGVVSETGDALLFDVQNGRSSVGFETVSNPPDCSRTAQMTSLPGESSIVVHDAR